MNKLSKRLSIIASQVSGKRVADIGCDHGKLTYQLLKNDVVDFVYISDISPKCLEKAIKLVSPLGNNVEAICCDGLQGFVGKQIDECIIAGMGGEEIVKIIDNSPIKISSFILSPQRNNMFTKKYVLNHGYQIIFDIIIKDKKKFYNIFKCIKSDKTQKISHFNLLFGKDNFSNHFSDIDEYLDFELQKYKNLIDNVSGQKKLEMGQYINLLIKAKNKRN